MEINWEELTLEMLIEKRKDLLDDHVATALEVATGHSETLQESLDTATAALETVTTERDTLLETQEPTEDTIAQVAALELSLAIEQAAQIGVGREIAAALKESVTSVEEIPATLKAVREVALMRALSRSPGVGTAKGIAKFKADGEEDDSNTDESEDPVTFTEGQIALMRLAG